MLFFKHHFCLLIGKEKYSCNSSRSIWRPKNNSYTTVTLSQKHVTSHLFHIRCISHCVYTNYLFLYFPYILVDKVVVSAILFNQKKLTDQMLYDASVLQQNEMSNMRNKTQMIKHFTYVWSSEQMSVYSISVYT